MVEHLKKFNLTQWIAENKAITQNKEHLWEDSDFWAFVTCGPNARKVFHVNPSDEIFQQLQGQLNLHFMDGDTKPQVAVLGPGDLFLLPAGVPHSPRREAGSSTLVITRQRTSDAEEQWFWYCDRCHTELHEVRITGRQMGEPVGALTEAALALKENAKLRTCSQCGHCSEV